MSRSSVNKSIWDTTCTINQTKNMPFNIDGAEFPSHEEQELIAQGFKAQSKAGFDKIVLAVYGMLVWNIQPTSEYCEIMQVGDCSFHCFRKDKFGMNLMAGCDHLCRFHWADLKHPGNTSEFFAFLTSPLGSKLEHDNNGITKRDKRWLEIMHSITADEDAYNFYHSQVRITIERAFGIFVHRLGILRRPLSVSMLKVPPLVMALMKLQSFCIDSNHGTTPSTFHLDEHSIHRMASFHGSAETTRNATAVHLDSRGIPDELIDSGHHFRDLPCQKRPNIPHRW
ncbi:hypothetical protein ACHAW6_007737 [Cyclotella cf. meneghiniana]